MSKCLLILIADDDAEDRFMMSEGFKELGQGDAIDFCEDGSKLLERLESINTKEVGLIVLDLNMPKLSGTETLRILKNHVAYKQIPVIIFSTSINEIEKAICIELGAMQYITKPSSWTKYVETCRYLHETCCALAEQ